MLNVMVHMQQLLASSYTRGLVIVLLDFAKVLCSPVKRALEGAVRSGGGAQDGGGDCGSCDGGCVPADGGAHPGRDPGCGDGGRDAGTHGEGLAYAGAGGSACDGGVLGPAAMTSSPSCGPWSSYFRWWWHPGGVKVLPSASE